MIILNIFDTFLEFINPIMEFFKDLWFDFSSFFLQYLSEDVFNILVFGILIAIALIIVLAIINNRN